MASVDFPHCYIRSRAKSGMDNRRWASRTLLIHRRERSDRKGYVYTRQLQISSTKIDCFSHIAHCVMLSSISFIFNLLGFFQAPVAA